MVVIGCSTPRPQARDSASDLASRPSGSGGVGAAAAVLRKYLEATAITHLDSTHTVPASLIGCDEEGIPDPAYYLAAGRVLDTHEPEVRGDTAVVRAVFAIAGELRSSSANAERQNLKIYARVDTAEWKLVRRSDGRWGVCGGPSTGGGFVRMGGATSTYQWSPRGSTWQTLSLKADSIRRAWNLSR